MNNRILWLDAVKGIGIFLVMVSHVCQIPNVFTSGYMPLFFVAAGLTYKSSTSFRETIAKKGCRLLIPYTVYGIIGLVVAFIYDYILGTLNSVSFTKELVGLLYMRSNFYWPHNYDLNGNMLGLTGPTWFLCCLFVTFVLLVIYERTKNKNLALYFITFLTLATYKIPYQLPWGGGIVVNG